MSSVVHVGLGKTATTTLQRHIFPLLAKRLGYHYNQPRLWDLLDKSTCVSLPSNEVEAVAQALRSERHFISMEYLVSRDPAFWEQSAIRNLSLLGRETRILITLREPLEWMTSSYQQVVHFGNIIRPENFFLPHDRHKLAVQLRGNTKSEYFCPDYLEFERLINFYRERFDHVCHVELSHIGKMDFIKTLFGINESFKKELEYKFSSAPHENRAYSSVAMSMTFQRERLLNIIGAKTMGSYDRRLDYYERRWSTGNSTITPYRELSDRDKLAKLPSRIVKRVAAYIYPGWEGFVRHRLDRIYPYQKYQLPPGVYLNQEKIEASREFLRRTSVGA